MQISTKKYQIKNNKTITDECAFCGEMIRLSPQKKYSKKKYPNRKFFCDINCYHKSKKGSGNPKWRGGKRIMDGYVYIYNPQHPFATKNGYVCEHRLNMEKDLGRYLNPEESVHHIDENRRNNNISNLRLFPTEAEHRSYHMKRQYRINGKVAKKDSL